jgi:hypothetical protein
MGVFEQAILDQIAARQVRRAALVKMEFESETIRAWAGVGPLVTTDGATWSGVGTLISISAISSGPGGAAGQLTIGLDGVDPKIVALARAERDELAGRFITLYLQYFDSAWQPVGAPKARWLGRMDTLRIVSTRPESNDGARVRGITLTAESWAGDRSRPSYGFYSDRDQQKRFPGDRGLERITILQDKVLTWPIPT